MASAALHLMLGGAEIDHQEFMGELHSHRLAAYVYDLRALGWPVETILEPAPRRLSRPHHCPLQPARMGTPGRGPKGAAVSDYSALASATPAAWPRTF